MSFLGNILWIVFGGGIFLFLEYLLGVWILLGGIWVALTHAAFAILCAVTIIGIPFALQHVKLASLALMPFGKKIVQLG